MTHLPMREVAFKTASSNPNLKGILPDDYITEWCFTDLNPPGTFKKDDGWRFFDEKDFKAILERNELLLIAKPERV